MNEPEGTKFDPSITREVLADTDSPPPTWWFVVLEGVTHAKVADRSTAAEIARITEPTRATPADAGEPSSAPARFRMCLPPGSSHRSDRTIAP